MFMHLCGLGAFRVTVFATLFSKTSFRADETVPRGFGLNLKIA